MWQKLRGRPAFALLAVGCLGLVGTGMVIQELDSIQPCPLCIFQRLLYLVIALWALLGLVLPRAHRAALVLTGLTALGGVATAGYQTWLQWVNDPALECSYTDPNLIERLVDWLGTRLPSLFLATGFCSSRDWTLFDLSMANWSLICFLAILGWLGVVSWRRA